MQVLDAADFVFRPPPQVSRARRVLIKPDARSGQPYPLSTSREMLEKIIAGIRRVGDADILIMEGHPEGLPMAPIYKSLNYSFPRVLTLDVKDCAWVEIESPLVKPLALPSAWVPNILLSCDYWINVATFKVVRGQAHLTIHNLLGLLPPAKYRWPELFGLGMDKVMADLYFTLPFDLAIIDARMRFIGEAEEAGQGMVEEYGKIFLGEPYEVDCKATQAGGANMGYLELVRSAKEELEV